MSQDVPFGAETATGIGETSNRRQIALGWAACLAWWIAAYVLTLDLQGWIFTELATLKAGRLSFTGMLADRATNGHCPLYFILSWTIQKVVGESTIALRLPSVVFTLLSVVAVHRIARRWASETTRILICLMVLLSSYILQVSQQARPYPLAMLFGLVASVVLVDSHHLPHRRRAILFGLLSLLGLLTSHAYWFVLLAHAVVLLGAVRRNLSLICATVVASIGALPWAIYAKYFAESGGLSELFLTWMGPVETMTSVALPGRLAIRLPFETGGSAVLPIVVSTIAVGLALLGLNTIPKKPCGSAPVTPRALLAALWGVPPLAALVSGLLGWGNLLLVPRYFAVTAVVQLILVFSAIRSTGRPFRLIGTALLALLLASESVVYLLDTSLDEVRRSARIIAAERTKGESIVMIADRSDVRLLKDALEEPVIGYFLQVPPSTDRETTNPPDLKRRKRGAWVLISRKSEATTASSRDGDFEISAYLENLRGLHHSESSRFVGEIEVFHFSDRIQGDPSLR